MNDSATSLRSTAESQNKLLKEFKSFQKKYLIVYMLVMGADWLQGPYLYMLYESYNLDLSKIATLFMTGFVSSAFAGTAVGGLADIYGRKRICVVYCFTMVFALVFRLFSIYSLLLLSHILSGLSTALLYTVFESWYISEHTSRGYLSKWKDRTFGLCTFLNGVSAIMAGVISNIAVNVWSYRAPYVAAIVMLCITFVIVSGTWTENYGAPQTVIRSFLTVLQEYYSHYVRTNFFECSMYIFVLLYTPALKLTSKKTVVASLGYLFSTMMLAVMIGSLIFRLYNQTNKSGYSKFLWSNDKLLAAALFLASCSFTIMYYYFQASTLFMVIAFHVFEFTTGVYYPSMSSLKAESISEETRSVVMTLIRIPMNFSVGVIIWQVSASVYMSVK
ncbi:hypothetical protein BY458DRAFT_446791 [Sporodiniella umbellata]|nr:hypothetical protein BY458DRAFT_446791 [Sporodiniella umbellata]